MMALWRMARVALHVLRGLAWCVVLPRLPARRAAQIRVRWSSQLLAILAVRVARRGLPVPGALVLANHVSWLDVVVLAASAPAVFVCKDEVRRWPLIGALVAASGTLFIHRAHARAAQRVCTQVAERLARGQRVVVFPEGTTSDGTRVLPFRSALIEAAIAARAPVQPVMLRYANRSAVYAGDTRFLQSLWRIARTRTLSVELAFLLSVDASHVSRRMLAFDAESRIAAALTSSARPCNRAETLSGLPAAAR